MVGCSTIGVGATGSGPGVSLAVCSSCLWQGNVMSVSSENGTILRTFYDFMAENKGFREVEKVLLCWSTRAICRIIDVYQFLYIKMKGQKAMRD
jgi:hypothetical protein